MFNVLFYLFVSTHTLYVFNTEICKEQRNKKSTLDKIPKILEQVADEIPF